VTVPDYVCGKELDPTLIDSGRGRVLGGAIETDPTQGTKILNAGKWYYFCSMRCRQRFMAGPELYLPRETGGGGD
jgi:YHS domain-containing protein